MIRLLVAGFVFLSVSVSCAAQTTIDISKHVFEDDARLQGPWTLYWDQLLSPADSATAANPETVTSGSWSRDGRHPVLGVATYHTRVILPEDHRGLSILFPALNSAARIWVNGYLEGERGVVSRDKDIYRPQMSGVMVAVPEGIRTLDVWVQVANLSGLDGGMFTPEINFTTSILSEISRGNGIENFFAGSLVAMFLYQLILFFLYERGRPHLWLALICLGVALRAMITHGGSFLLPELFPSVSWELWKKIEYGAVYGVVAFFPLYVYHLFVEHAPRWPMYFFVGVSVLLGVVIVFGNLYNYGSLLDVGHLGLLLGFIYAVYSIGNSWRMGNRDARIILYGVLAAFPFIMLEILKNSPLLRVTSIQFAYLVETGVLVFLGFQVYLLASHYARSYRGLEALNQDLERMVAERTEELSAANAVKDRLLSIVSHDVKSPINAIKGMMQVFSQGGVSREEFDKIRAKLERDVNSTSILVENILYWTASQMKGIQMHPEDFDLKALLDKNVKLFQSLEQEKGLAISHNLTEATIVRTDPNIIDLVVRNLVSNGIKFSHQNGKIEITAIAQPRKLTVQVKDHGLGMNSETLQAVFSVTRTSSRKGTARETGTGLGLSLCRDYLQKAGGSMSVESIEGSGSTFTFEVPLGQ